MCTVLSGFGGLASAQFEQSKRELFCGRRSRFAAPPRRGWCDYLGAGGCNAGIRRFTATPLRGRRDHFRSRRRHDGFSRSPEAALLCHR
jgi:hypothetical protein